MSFQAVSCFRSTGSMPVARPVTMIIPNYLPHKERHKRKITDETAEKKQELVLKHATVEELNSCDFTSASNVDCEEEPLFCNAVTSVADHKLETVIKPMTLKLINCEPEKPKQEQRCKKHSRCHCDLLSLETTDFFTIKV